MKLTRPQKLYLARAVQLGAWCNRGVYFSLWVPGRTNTARCLLKLGLIETCTPAFGWPYMLSEQAASYWVNLPFEERQQLLAEVKP